MLPCAQTPTRPPIQQFTRVQPTIPRSSGGRMYQQGGRQSQPSYPASPRMYAQMGSQQPMEEDTNEGPFEDMYFGDPVFQGEEDQDNQ